MNFHALTMLLLTASSMAESDSQPSARFARDLQEAGRAKREPVRTDEDLRRIAAAQAKRERRANRNRKVSP